MGSSSSRKRSWLHGTARIGFGLAVVAGLTWCLASSLNSHVGIWREREVAPFTVYAPFRFVVQDQDRQIAVEQGELVVSKGERLTDTHVARLTALHQAQDLGRTGSRWLGAFLFALLFTMVGAVYLKRYEPRMWQAPKQLICILTVAGILLAIARLVLSSPLNDATVPVASVSMLLGMLLSPRMAIIVGLLVSGLIGTMARADLVSLSSLSVGCFVGAYVVQGVRRRIDFARAGLMTGLAQAATMFSGYLLMQGPVDEAVTRSVASFIGGSFFSVLLTFCLLPFCESIFGLITDVSLLELSDLNHPLLKELSVKAPGTYHHSLLVANLAEAACEAIGASALLARVGCYFHDVGKMFHPEYFVENQPPDVSRHDRLQPSMSSLVILNHVKEGVELAHRHRLNQAIIDFIPGHHGTGLIYYFYRRALEEVEDQELLKEERFLYPGPKPHGRETAVALLAHSVEAATRALKQKSSARIEEVVHRIINNKFIDGQLEDCDLTLRDLSRISEAFLRELAGIYHSRVEYPKAPGEEEESRPLATG